MYVNETEIKVRYKETDQMGIVHHSNYLPWFEVGRTEYFEAIGFSYREIEKQGIMFPLSESYVHYKNGSKYQDIIIIRTWIDTLTPARFKVCYEAVRKVDMLVMATGYTVMAVTDCNFKPISLKKASREVWEAFSRCAGAVEVSLKRGGKDNEIG